MERINKEHINGETPLRVIVEFLKQNVDDKYPRARLDDFEHGCNAGFLKCLDTLEEVCNVKNKYKD